MTTAATPRRGPGRPRGAVTGQTRDMALDVAARLFGTSGYRGTSLADVAQAAGLSNAGLLHHFPSKQHLLIEVLRRRDEVDRAAFRFAQTTGTSDETVWDQLDSLVELARTNSERPGMVKLYTTVSGEAIDADHPAHGWLRDHLSAADRANCMTRSKPGRRWASCGPRRRRRASPAPASHCSTACRSSGWPARGVTSTNHRRRRNRRDEPGRQGFRRRAACSVAVARADRRLTFPSCPLQSIPTIAPHRGHWVGGSFGTKSPQSGQTRGAQHTGSPPKSSKFRSAGGLAAGGAAGTVTAGSGEFSVTEELPAHRRRQPALEARRRPAALDHQSHVGRRIHRQPAQVGGLGSGQTGAQPADRGK